MKLLDWILRFYPPSWRERYEDEFRAMLEQYRLRPQDWLDILYGALDAHLHASGAGLKGGEMNAHRWTLRLGGLGALLSPAMILFSFLVIPLLVGETALEGSQEFLLLASITPLLPAVLALHRLLGPHYPRASRWVMLIGLVGTLTLPAAYGVQAGLNALVSALNLAPESALAWTGKMYIFLLGLSGLWMLAAAYLGMKASVMPVGLAVLGLAAGMGWVLIIPGLFLTSLPP